MNTLTLWIVNFLTLFRMVVGVIIYRSLVRPDPLWGVACTLFVLAALSDFVDGWGARYWHATTSFGAALDPVADKILSFFLVTAFWQQGALPLSGFLILLLRDLVILLGVVFLSLCGTSFIFRPLWVGKLFTAFLFLFFVIYLGYGALFHEWPRLERGWAAMLLVLLLGSAIVSGVAYVKEGWRLWQIS